MMDKYKMRQQAMMTDQGPLGDGCPHMIVGRRRSEASLLSKTADRFASGLVTRESLEAFQNQNAVAPK